jgi:hypothetical protein
VLRPGGGLGLIWNIRDPGDDIQHAVTRLLDPLVPPGRPSISASVAAFVERTFSEVEKHAVPFAQELDEDAVIGRIFSISFVEAAPAPKRRELEDALRALVAAHGGRIPFRYVTEAFAMLNVA